MDKFPFTKDEWRELEDISYEMVNFVYREDRESPELCSKFAGIIKKLENKYGKHPKLSETLADHTDDIEERKKLYSEALELARKNGLPTITIRIAFARMLIEEVNDKSSALRILQAERNELKEHDDEIDLEEYYDLKRKVTIRACK